MPRAIPGVNDLYTWCTKNEDRGKQLLYEWCGIDDQGNCVDINNVAQQSNKKVMWKCQKGHTWYTKIQKRTLLSSNCPYCTKQKAIPGETDLKTWCIKNNRIDLIEQFTGIDKNNNKVSMLELMPMSHRSIKWKHLVNGETHTWVASISDRTAKNSGCPICNSKNLVIKGKNDLYTWCNSNGDFGELLMNQWIGLDKYNKLVKMDEIAMGNGSLKIAWMCGCGNIWYSTALKRTWSRSEVCPECSIKNREYKRYKRILYNNSLKEWCIQNGEIGDIISKQFVGKDEQGNDVSMDNITFASSKKVWWRHKTFTGEIHDWLATPHNRTLKESMCPYCNHLSTSLNEQIIYRSIKRVHSNTVNRAKINGFEYDIYIPELRLGIEYDGEFYHKNKKEHDKIKDKNAKDVGMKFIRVISTKDNSKETVWRDDLIIDNFEGNMNKVFQVTNWILRRFGEKIDEDTFNSVVFESKLYLYNLKS